MRLHTEQRRKIWEERIKHKEFQHSTPSPHPVTIMVGAQPGAGKTQAIKRLNQLYPNENLTYINPDELRMYHPDTERLMTENPTAMPKRTAHASADWTAKSIQYANEHQYSTKLESTWRNCEKAINTMQQAKDAGRTVHIVALAVPPTISRLAILQRYYGMKLLGEPARWVSPIDHDEIVQTLPLAIEKMSESPLPDEFVALSQDGVLYRGPDGRRFLDYWGREFTRELTNAESSEIHGQANCLEGIIHEIDPDNSETVDAVDDIQLATAFVDMPKMPYRRVDQPRQPNGQFDFGRR